jgi:hypothetical protein
MPAPGPGPQLPPMRQPESPGGYSDWIRRERDLNRPPMTPPPFQPPPPMPQPWQPPPTIPGPHVGVGSQPPGGGTGPVTPPLPPPFTSPIFPVPAPKPPDNVGILELADRLFRPGRGGAFIPLAE